MRNLLVAILFILVSGCVGIAPPRFDNAEYNKAVELTHSLEALQTGCEYDSDVFVTALVTVIWQADGFVLYTKYLPNDIEVHNVSKVIKEDLLQIKDRLANQTFNAKYCELKTSLVHKKAERILKAIGQEIRK